MATGTDTDTGTTEDVESFRLRARAWLADNMPRLPPGASGWTEMDVGPDVAARARVLQGMLNEGGFTGIAYPAAYGGRGLTREHQLAFNEESRGYEMPMLFNTPTLTIIGPTILDFGTEEQKQRHLRAMFSGEELWVQFMSEPTGGSDMAGAITRATRDGDVWILNGSKIWSSYAYFSDYGICLARTDWDVPKHRGLTMFIVKINQPGVHVEKIRQTNGGEEFCQEFFDDVPLRADAVIGKVNDGWTVATRLLVHERSGAGGGSPYASGTGSTHTGKDLDDLLALARKTGRDKDARSRQLIAEAHVNNTVHRQLVKRVATGIANKSLPEPAGSLVRLFGSVSRVHRTNVGYEVSGASAVTWPEDEGNLGGYGEAFVFRQAACLGGGSTEMQRNIISERVLAMPREYAADRDKPFGEVRRNQMPTRPS